ncbi:MAG: hypothetical protein ACE5PV_16630 [Candidatus Poribacteria bacterium]
MLPLDEIIQKIHWLADTNKLNPDEWEQRLEDAYDYLEQFGDEIIPILIEYLHHDKLEGGVLCFLQYLKGEKIANKFMELFDTVSEEGKIQILGYLSLWDGFNDIPINGDCRYEAFYRKCLSSQNPEIRKYAVNILRKCGRNKGEYSRRC